MAYVAKTKIQHGKGADVFTFNLGDTLNEDVFSQQDLEGLLSVGAIEGTSDSPTSEPEEPTSEDDDNHEDPNEDPTDAEHED